MLEALKWRRIAWIASALGLALVPAFVGGGSVRAEDSSCQGVCIDHCTDALDQYLRNGYPPSQCGDVYRSCKAGCQDNPPCGAEPPSDGGGCDPVFGPPSVDPDG